MPVTPTWLRRQRESPNTYLGLYVGRAADTLLGYLGFFFYPDDEDMNRSMTWPAQTIYIWGI